VASGALLGLGGASLTKRRALGAERLAQKTMPRAMPPIARMGEAEALRAGLITTQSVLGNL
jgi:hypothetical protein